MRNIAHVLHYCVLICQAGTGEIACSVPSSMVTGRPSGQTDTPAMTLNAGKNPTGRGVSLGSLVFGRRRQSSSSAGHPRRPRSQRPLSSGRFQNDELMTSSTGTEHSVRPQAPATPVRYELTFSLQIRSPPRTDYISVVDVENRALDPMPLPRTALLA